MPGIVQPPPSSPTIWANTLKGLRALTMSPPLMVLSTAVHILWGILITVFLIVHHTLWSHLPTTLSVFAWKVVMGFAATQTGQYTCRGLCHLVCYKIKDGKHKRDNLQFCDGQMFNFTYRALEYEPTHLNNHNPFGEKVSFTLVSNFFLGDIGEVNIVGIREELEIFWGKSVLCFSILEASHKCKKNMRLGPSTT